MADKKDQVERPADDGLDVTQFVEIKKPVRPAIAKITKQGERMLEESANPDDEKLQRTLRAKHEKKRKKEVQQRYGKVKEDTVNLAKSKSTATAEEESIGVILQKGHDAGQIPVASTPKSSGLPNTTYKVETVWIKDNAVKRYVPDITPKSPKQ